MRMSAFFPRAALAIALSLGGGVLTAMPAAAQTTAAHTPAQVKAALQQALAGANLTGKQKLQVHAIVQNYDQQTAGADAAATQAAQKNLVRSINGILTPAQQAEVKASLQQSLGSS